MTYGPQPGWNPNQPPVGPQPGYPAGQQPGMPQPGPMHPGTMPAGQPQLGQPPVGQYGQQGQGPSGPKSPLPVIAGALSLLTFAYTAYSTIILVLALTAKTGYPSLRRLINSTVFAVALSGRAGNTILTVVVGLVTILFLIAGLLTLTRKPSGRVVAIIASVCAIALTVYQFIQVPSSHYLNGFDYAVPVIALLILVLSLLPATGQALHSNPPAYVPPFPQQQFSQPYQQPGYPQQQTPGGYQQPPGGTPS